jgi:hypothetical protein
MEGRAAAGVSEDTGGMGLPPGRLEEPRWRSRVEGEAANWQRLPASEVESGAATGGSGPGFLSPPDRW